MRKALLFLIIIFTVNSISINQTFGHPDTTPPAISSESAIVIESKSGKVLYEKDPFTKMYPASLTKIATAIYAIEKGNVEETVIVSKKASNTGGSSVYLEENEQVTLKKLIQGLLLNSGNDAGVAIAEHLSVSEEQFSSDINDYVTNVIGVQNTHFANSHGLFDPNHVTTAADMAKITQYAMNNKLFREIFGMKELEWKGQSWDTTLFTHHKLMREIPYEGITGGKTGFVNESGFTLATTAERENLNLIVISLNSNLKSEVYNDTINLLDYAFGNFQTSSILKGASFILDGEEYKAGKKLYYTHAQANQVRKELKDNGTLEVIDQDEKVIATFSLDRIKPIVSNTNPETKNIKKEINDVELSSAFENSVSIAFIFVVFLTFVGVIFYRQTKKTY